MAAGRTRDDLDGDRQLNLSLVHLLEIVGENETGPILAQKTIARRVMALQLVEHEVTRPVIDPETGEPAYTLGLRPDQCAYYLSAWLRRQDARRSAQLDALTARVLALETAA